MRKSCFTQAQTIGMIKEQEADMPTADVFLRHGLSPAAFCKLTSWYGGMAVSDAAKLKALEDQNATLKRLLADTMLDRAIGAPLVRETMERVALKDLLENLNRHLRARISVQGQGFMPVWHHFPSVVEAPEGP